MVHTFVHNVHKMQIWNGFELYVYLIGLIRQIEYGLSAGILKKEKELINHRRGRKIPRTQRLIINDETAVYHAWDVEPNIPSII